MYLYTRFTSFTLFMRKIKINKKKEMFYIKKLSQIRSRGRMISCEKINK